MIYSSPSVCATQQSFPVYWETVPAGFPTPVLDTDPEFLDLNALLVRNPAATFYMRAATNSMEHAGIYAGDLLIVDRSINVQVGKVVVAVVEGEFITRRVQKHSGKWMLIAESPYVYQEITLDECIYGYIWGVVSNVIHSLL